MKAFTQLFMNLDATNRTQAKIDLLKDYLSTVPSGDAAWAIYFLSGHRLKRSVKLKDFREWAGESCGYPTWMVEECYQQVGDLAETLALLLASPSRAKVNAPMPGFQSLVEDFVVPLRGMEPVDQKQKLISIWQQLDGMGCFVFNKLITGGFRVGVSQTLVHRALAELAGIEPAVMAHKLMGDWTPAAAAYEALFDLDALNDDPACPYPFCLAYPLEVGDPEDLASILGPVSNWQIEWKWDGIRAQLIKRQGEIILWSRGEEIVSEQFPEICETAAQLPDGTVLDGELLAWQAESDQVASFAALQRRLGRKTVGAKLRAEVPVKFMAYDLMEVNGADLRGSGTGERQAHLQRLLDVAETELLRSPSLQPESWSAVAALRASSRDRGVEGLMLKQIESEYLTGRKKGAWWKWKVDPYTVDAVLVYGQQGHGRRAGLYTDYTFSIWDGDELVPFAKAYSGLSDKEIREVDKWIRAHTRDKHGPVRVVDPELVFEIAFEGISESKRHKSGIAVRFPRIHRWRRDKPAKEADSLQTVKALLDWS